MKEYITPDIWGQYGPKSCEPDKLPEENGVLMSEPEKSVLKNEPEATAPEENGQPQKLKEEDHTNSAEIYSLPSRKDSKSLSQNIENSRIK